MTIEQSYLSKDAAVARLTELRNTWVVEGMMNLTTASFIYDILTAVGFSDEEVEAIFPEAYHALQFEPCIPA